MAVYKFQVSLPATDTLPRNRVTNCFHMQHIAGSVLDTDLETLCADICAMYQTRYNNQACEVNTRAYAVGPPPNVPKANVTVDPGMPWGINTNRETALCLSFAGSNRGDKRRRGRIYLEPGLLGPVNNKLDAVRPDENTLQWALAFYEAPNASFPDLGGPDWQFGIWSHVGQHFTVAQQAWVNDEWDAQRRRGLRETRRVSSTRQG